MGGIPPPGKGICPMKATRILETCLYVTDLTAAEAFYTGVLGLRVITKQPGRHLFLRCGDRSVLLLFNPDETIKPEPLLGVPTHGSHGQGHAAFAMTESEIPQWREHLTARGVAIEKELSWPTGGHSIYFRDPSGNSLEFATPRLWNLEP